MEKCKLLVEGSAAIVLGALDRYQDQFEGKKVVLVVCGGNIDVNLISRIIDRGLMRSGRRIHLRVQILDRPGSLSKLTALIAGLKANVLQAIHDRSEMKIRLDETEVELMLETRGPDHAAEVIAALEKECRNVTVIS
jgi:threonine dehydratase